VSEVAVLQALRLILLLKRVLCVEVNAGLYRTVKDAFL
jgi:hypothetical protein